MQNEYKSLDYYVTLFMFITLLIQLVKVMLNGNAFLTSKLLIL